MRFCVGRFSTWCAVALLAWAGGPSLSCQNGSSLAAGPYYALVIGNNDYQHLPKLQTAENDAREIATLLRERYGFQVKLLPNADRQQIITALIDYRQSLPQHSNLLIYYAGHGFHDRDTDESYWLPVDAEKDNSANWISADDITRQIRAISATHVLLISDSCYSGYLSRGADAEINPKDRSAYLSKMLASKSRNLISSGGDEPVADGGAPGHSIFASVVIRSLRQIDQNDFTAADLFYGYIQPGVGGQSKQLPQYSWIQNSGHLWGDFVFSRAGGRADSSGVTASSPSAVARPSPSTGNHYVIPRDGTPNTDAPAAYSAPNAGPPPASLSSSGPFRTASQAQKEIKSPAEYNAYVKALQTTNPGQKVQALDSFLKAYPNSVMAEDAALLLMASYQQAGDALRSLQAADRVLQVNPNNVRALAFRTYNYRALASAGGPQMQDNLVRTRQDAERGLMALQNLEKPADMSDADFVRLHNATGAIFDGAMGFAVLQAKDYANAQRYLEQAVLLDSEPSLADIYPLAVSCLAASPPNPMGFWYLVRASMLAQPSESEQILDYGKKKYVRFHGSDVGWTELINDAKSSASVVPPPNFRVAAVPAAPSSYQMAADLVRDKGPTQMSFAEWQLVLSSGNQQAADTVWTAIKGKAVKLGAVVVTAAPYVLELAGSQDDIEAKETDITVSMAKPIPWDSVPARGGMIFVQGTLASYTTGPFMMRMNDGILLDKNGKPLR